MNETNRAGASPSEAPGLRRTVGLLGASVSGIAIVLGAGIYVLVGEAAGLGDCDVQAASVKQRVYRSLHAGLRRVYGAM